MPCAYGIHTCEIKGIVMPKHTSNCGICIVTISWLPEYFCLICTELYRIKKSEMQIDIATLVDHQMNLIDQQEQYVNSEYFFSDFALTPDLKSNLQDSAPEDMEIHTSNIPYLWCQKSGR